MTDHLLLVGMMGAGKSTVGRLVARALGRPFVDVDDEIERSSGSSIAELFSHWGEAGFRAQEAEALERCLDGAEDQVVSVGGGAVLSAENRERLAGGTVVWLRARPETLAQRVGDGSGRPLLTGRAGGAAPRLAELNAERAPLYESVADAVVDVDGLSPEAVAERVVASVREICR